MDDDFWEGFLNGFIVGSPFGWSMVIGVIVILCVIWLT